MIKNTIFSLLITLLFSFPLKSQELISSQSLGALSKTQMVNLYGVFMQNGVERYKITYTTKDVHGVQDTASGLIVLPLREDVMIYPLMCYQHGTVDGPTDVPSNLNGGSTVAIIWAGLGFVTSAADYLGLGESRGFHPYVHARTEASAAIDMLFATKQFIAENDYHINEQLFISGYSQGGHAAMAVQKEIQTNYAQEFNIIAAAPMSGAYSISTAMKNLANSNEPYYYLGYLPYSILSLRLAYNLDYELEEIFKAPYIPAIQSFYNNEIGVSALSASLTNTISNQVGLGPIPALIFQDTFVLNTTNNPNHPFNLALKDNDTYDWAPTAPTRLYYCMADDQVPFQNSIIADSVMNMNGALDVMAIDVNSNFDHGQCANPAITQAAFFFGQYQSITTAVKESNVTAPLLFYPNPSSGILNFTEMESPVDISIYDIKGKLYSQINVASRRTTLDLSHLPKGLYILRWIRDNKTGTEKIILE